MSSLLSAVSADVLDRVRRNAAAHNRTLEQEIASVLADAVKDEPPVLGPPLESPERPAPYDLEIEGPRERVTPVEGGEPRLAFWFDEHRAAQ